MKGNRKPGVKKAKAVQKIVTKALKANKVKIAKRAARRNKGTQKARKVAGRLKQRTLNNSASAAHVNATAAGAFKTMAGTSSGSGRYYNTLTSSNSFGGKYNTIVLPFDDPVPQPISAHDSNKIVALRLYDVLPLDFTADASGAGDNGTHYNKKDRFIQGDGQFIMNIFKDPFRSSVHWEPNASGNYWTYQIYFSNVKGIDAAWKDVDYALQRALPLTYAKAVAGSHTYTAETTVPGPIIGDPDVVTPGTITFAAMPTGAPPHRATWYAGEGECASFNSARYFWIDCAFGSQYDPVPSNKPAFVYLVHSIVNSGNGFKPAPKTFQLYLKTSGVCRHYCYFVTHTYNITDPSGATSLRYVSRAEVNTRGYYTIVMDGVNTTEFTIESAYICLPNVDFMSHQCVPDLELTLEYIKQMRVTSAATMVSCIAPALQVAGSVFGYQFNSANKPWYTTGDNIMDMLTTNDFKMGAWVNGMYAFVKPKTDLDFDLKQYVKLGEDNKTIVDISYPMDTDEYVQIRVDTAHSRSGIGYLTRGWVIEFTTDSRWLNGGAKLVKPNSQAVEKLLGVISRTPQFHDNPLHVSDLMHYLKTGASFALKNGPALYKLFKGLTM